MVGNSTYSTSLFYMRGEWDGGGDRRLSFWRFKMEDRGNMNEVIIVWRLKMVKGFLWLWGRCKFTITLSETWSAVEATIARLAIDENVCKDWTRRFDTTAGVLSFVTILHTYSTLYTTYNTMYIKWMQEHVMTSHVYQLHIWHPQIFKNQNHTFFLQWTQSTLCILSHTYTKNCMKLPKLLNERKCAASHNITRQFVFFTLIILQYKI